MISLSVKLFKSETINMLLGDTKSLFDLVTTMATMSSIKPDDIPVEGREEAFVNGDKVTGKWVDQKFEGDEYIAFRKPGDKSPIFGAPKAKIGPKKKKKVKR